MRDFYLSVNRDVNPKTVRGFISPINKDIINVIPLLKNGARLIKLFSFQFSHSM